VTATPAASLYDFALAVHVMAVVVAFGVTFAYPIMFAAVSRSDPRSLALVYRIEYTTERWLVNPGLLVVLLLGIYLASEGHQWSEFFVQWGLGAVVVIGGVVGAVMMPTAKRAELLAQRGVAAAGDGPVELGEEYRSAVRRLSLAGGLLSALVLITILFMVIKP
jgi:hypothetical protein